MIEFILFVFLLLYGVTDTCDRFRNYRKFLQSVRVYFIILIRFLLVHFPYNTNLNFCATCCCSTCLAKKKPLTDISMYQMRRFNSHSPGAAIFSSTTILSWRRALPYLLGQVGPQTRLIHPDFIVQLSVGTSKNSTRLVF